MSGLPEVISEQIEEDTPVTIMPVEEEPKPEKIRDQNKFLSDEYWEVEGVATDLNYELEEWVLQPELLEDAQL